MREDIHRPVLVREEVHHPVHPVSGFEGSYVAVAGDSGRGSVHVVENVPALGRDSVTVVNGQVFRNRAVATVVTPVQVVGGVPPRVPHPGAQGVHQPRINNVLPSPIRPG